MTIRPNHPAARHGDVGILERLLVGELNRASLLERPELTVLHEAYPGLVAWTLNRPAGGIEELELAFGVGDDDLDADIRALQAHLRPPQRRAGVG